MWWLRDWWEISIYHVNLIIIISSSSLISLHQPPSSISPSTMSSSSHHINQHHLSSLSNHYLTISKTRIYHQPPTIITSHQQPSPTISSHSKTRIWKISVLFYIIFLKYLPLKIYEMVCLFLFIFYSNYWGDYEMWDGGLMGDVNIKKEDEIYPICLTISHLISSLINYHLIDLEKHQIPT